ncbi:Spo0E family sporulation regulatory protein-aspartic acid phosphatase [Mesobacillus foraminis]|uniref:Spo0E family sporulation regulatory protein-aspartic acid phosphatase n=1 Tax=Mesobacillus foraminis TaxID=279826 RepID=UPI000EF490EC|nr:Spo0E family sporulation regulatory protein-aspartic acid phosphatase [Mesobacillus foraminis]
MILKEALDLSKSIANYRLHLYELGKIKGSSDPDVIKMRQQLDSKIITIEKVIGKVHSSQPGAF